jgi:amino acid transporter
MWDAVALIVGVTIGSGIFATPPLVAGHLPGVGPMLAVWVLGGLLALCGALCYAELTAMFPHTGGAYVFLREGYGRLPAFTFGWSSLFVTYPASIAAVSVVFVAYLARLVPLSDAARPVVAAGLCLLLTGLNILGVRAGAWTLKIFTSAKVLALGAIVVAALAVRRGPLTSAAPFWSAPPEGWTAAAVALSLVSVLWTYEGWADGPTIAGEMRNRSRDIVRALLVSTLGVTAIYVLTNLAYVRVLGIDGVRGSDSVAVDVATPLFGRSGSLFVTLLVLASTLGSILGMVIAGSRVIYAMGRDGLFFEVAAYVHPRFRTPAAALAALGVVSAVYALLGSFETIIRYFVFVAQLWFVFIIASVVLHRIKRPEADRPFRTPLYPAPVVLYLLVAGGLLYQLARSDLRGALAGVGIVVASVPVYAVWMRLRPAR